MGDILTHMTVRNSARVLGLAIPDDAVEKTIKIDFDSLEDLLKSMNENELESIFNS